MTDLKKDLSAVAAEDVRVLVEKDAEYGSSWCRRGGVGAFMMLARKFDRIETQSLKHGYDIFAAIRADPRPEGLLDDVQDLRRYLALVEAYIIAEKRPPDTILALAAEQPEPAPAELHRAMREEERCEWAPGLAGPE